MHRPAIVLAALACLISCTSAPETPSAARGALAPGGKLRAGITDATVAAPAGRQPR